MAGARDVFLFRKGFPLSSRARCNRIAEIFHYLCVQKTNKRDMNKLTRIILSALLLLSAWLVERNCELPVWQLMLVYLVPYLLIGYDVIAEAVEGIVEGDPFDECFLMVVATVGAMGIGFLPGGETEFLEGVFVMLFFQIGEYFEHFAEHRSRHSIEQMMNLRPDTANLLRNEEIVVVNPSEIKAGDTLVVRPGEKIPVDGVVKEGHSSLNMLALTGESMPHDVEEGNEVISGCVNLQGALTITATKGYAQSTATRILELVENAGKKKSRQENFIRRFAHVYTPIVVFAAVALAFVPPFFSEADYADSFSTWLYRALTFLVVSCPCALVMSVPLTFFGGIGAASRKGILIKGGSFMDTLAKLGTVVFDKTGTLTRGVFEVEAVHPQTLDKTALLHLVAHVESLSTHPVASVLRLAYGHSCHDCRVEDIREVAGQGIVATVNGQRVAVGSDRLMEAEGAKWHACSHAVGTTIHVAIDGEYEGHVVVSDRLKADSARAIRALKQAGVKKTVMLTGDHQQVADDVALRLGIDEHHAQLLPADKVSHVERLLHEAPSTLAFVGDGINDAPVLARADVGIAMGALGSDAAIEAADVVLMDDNPCKIATAITIARHTLAIARQNVAFAITIKVVILILSALGLVPMALAVFGDVGVMVLCVLNAMRALRVK